MVIGNRVSVLGAWLAQSVEHAPLDLGALGSHPHVAHKLSLKKYVKGYMLSLRRLSSVPSVEPNAGRWAELDHNSNADPRSGVRLLTRWATQAPQGCLFSYLVSSIFQYMNFSYAVVHEL